MKYKVDYKGKHYILQDELYEDMDYEVGKMDDHEITDDFLKGHIEACNYYGIPAYLGMDKSLRKRIKKLTPPQWVVIINLVCER